MKCTTCHLDKPSAELSLFRGDLWCSTCLHPTCPVCLDDKPFTELSLFRGELWCLACQRDWETEQEKHREPTRPTEQSEETECFMCCENTDLVPAHIVDHKPCGSMCASCLDALLNSYCPKCNQCNALLEQTPEQVERGRQGHVAHTEWVWAQERQVQEEQFQVLGITLQDLDEVIEDAVYSESVTSLDDLRDAIADEIGYEVFDTNEDYIIIRIRELKMIMMLRCLERLCVLSPSGSTREELDFERARIIDRLVEDFAPTDEQIEELNIQYWSLSQSRSFQRMEVLVQRHLDVPFCSWSADAETLHQSILSVYDDTTLYTDDDRVWVRSLNASKVHQLLQYLARPSEQLIYDYNVVGGLGFFREPIGGFFRLICIVMKKRGVSIEFRDHPVPATDKSRRRLVARLRSILLCVF